MFYFYLNKCSYLSTNKLKPLIPEDVDATLMIQVFKIDKFVFVCNYYLGPDANYFKLNRNWHTKENTKDMYSVFKSFSPK